MGDEMTSAGSETGCGTMPSEFVRMRYFFGQRLGVMELSDQAAYHAGKHAFHNARLHGAGVLCGLRAERFPFRPDERTTVLRIRRGAALDALGREIIVGVDQCIDVAAWLAKKPLGIKEPLRLWVALRYRECPSDPAPAPRDPCSCNNGGCDFGRVREGFELALLTDEERKASTAVDPPAIPPLSGPRERLERRIHELVAADCPEPPVDSWLFLAAITVTVDLKNGVAVDIGAIDNAVPERRSLLPMVALQSMLLDLVAAGADAGITGAGPRIGALTLEQSTVDGSLQTELVLAVRLAKAGDPLVDEPLAKGTLNGATEGIKLHKLDHTREHGLRWADITDLLGEISCSSDQTPHLRIALNALAAGRYRLTIDQPFDAPIADTMGRALQPQRFARLFTINFNDRGQLELDPSV